MKMYVCICGYWVTENDGNGDIKLFIFAGQVFLVEWLSDLPGNVSNDFDNYYKSRNLL